MSALLGNKLQMVAVPFQQNRLKYFYIYLWYIEIVSQLLHGKRKAWLKHFRTKCRVALGYFKHSVSLCCHNAFFKTNYCLVQSTSIVPLATTAILLSKIFRMIERMTLHLGPDTKQCSLLTTLCACHSTPLPPGSAVFTSIGGF